MIVKPIIIDVLFVLMCLQTCILLWIVHRLGRLPKPERTYVRPVPRPNQRKRRL